MKTYEQKLKKLARDTSNARGTSKERKLLLEQYAWLANGGEIGERRQGEGIGLRKVVVDFAGFALGFRFEFAFASLGLWGERTAWSCGVARF